MRVLLLAALSAVPASAAQMPNAPAPLFSDPTGPELLFKAPALDGPVINPSPRAALGLCPPTTAQIAADRAQKTGGDLYHKLTDLPPANDYVAVYRQVNGCEAPIVVKYGLGRR